MTLPSFTNVKSSWLHWMYLGALKITLCKKHRKYYKLKHLKHIRFAFINYWFMLKDMPKWVYMHDNFKKSSPPKMLNPLNNINGQECKHCVLSNKFNVKIVVVVPITPTKWHQGVIKAKKVDKWTKTMKVWSKLKCMQHKTWLLQFLKGQQFLKRQPSWVYSCY